MSYPGELSQQSEGARFHDGGSPGDEMHLDEIERALDLMDSVLVAFDSEDLDAAEALAAEPGVLAPGSAGDPVIAG